MKYSVNWGSFCLIEKDHLDVFPEEACIYEIWSLNKTTDEPLHKKYIDQANNLQEKLLQHFSTHETNRDLYTFLLSYRSKVRFFEINHESDRKQIVKLLYEKYHSSSSYVLNSRCPGEITDSLYDSISNE